MNFHMLLKFLANMSVYCFSLLTLILLLMVYFCRYLTFATKVIHTHVSESECLSESLYHPHT